MLRRSHASLLRPALAVVLASTLSLSACGGSSDDDKAAASISHSLQAGGSSQTGMDLSHQQADCIGKGMVDAVGVDTLKKKGLLTDDLKVDRSVSNVTFSHEDATQVVDSMFSCAPVMSRIKKSLTSSTKLTADQRDCLDKALTEKAVKGAFVGVFSGDKKSFTTKLMGPLSSCMMPSGQSN